MGDSVTVTLPTTATVTNKVTSGSSVVLTTAATHYFSLNDRVVVSLPSSAVITGTRSFSGSNYVDVEATEATTTTCYLTVATGHGFLVGQQIMVTGVSSRFNGLHTVTNVGATSIDYEFAGVSQAEAVVTSGIAVNIAPSYLCTVNTTAAHNFSVGDSITVNIQIPSTVTVTNRSATTTACTLTTSTTHNFSVGEQITVSGVGSRYNGTFYITGVDVGNKTITYLFDGTAESSTSSTGTVVNNMIASGYNGTKIIETIPSSTSLTYYYYGQDLPTSSSLLGTTPTIVNNTNTSLNGTVTVSSTPSATQFGYTKVA